LGLVNQRPTGRAEAGKKATDPSEHFTTASMSELLFRLALAGIGLRLAVPNRGVSPQICNVLLEC
jgi:hypothetical protein